MGDGRGHSSLDGVSDQALWFPVLIFSMSSIHVSFISLTNLQQPAPPAGLVQVLPGAHGHNQGHYLALTDSTSACC